jgi:hypothetical protein
LTTPPPPPATDEDPDASDPGRTDEGEQRDTDIPDPTSDPLAQSPLTPDAASGKDKTWVQVGLAVLAVIVIQVRWFWNIGTWIPGLLLTCPIAIIGAGFAIRSGQSRPRKAMFVIALVLAYVAPLAVKRIAGWDF